MEQKNQGKDVGHRNTSFSTPWVFILAEGILPGQFFLQPLNPGPDELAKLDPYNVILEETLYAFVTALAAMDRFFIVDDDRPLHRLAVLSARLIEKTYAGLAKVQVIPLGELRDREERGEFSLRLPNEYEMDRWRSRFEQVRTKVYNEIRCGRRHLPISSEVWRRALRSKVPNSVYTHGRWMPIPMPTIIRKRSGVKEET